MNKKVAVAKKEDPALKFLKKEVVILVQRKVYNATKEARNIISDVFVNGKWLCYILEDRLQPDGKKVPKETCIPQGEYEMELTYSNRFKRMMPLIFNKKSSEGSFVSANGIKWFGIRVHGGNTEEDTEGCLLCGYHVNADKTAISGSATDAFIRILATNPGRVKLII
jgi:hypothetical protein